MVFATSGYKVYRSANKGLNWTDISQNLPQITINSIAYDTNTNEGLYIGTIFGVFYKNAGMTEWVEYSTNLPKVSVRDLKFYHDPVDPSKSLVKAATYGRGLWQAPLYSYADAMPEVQKVNFDSGTVVFNVVATNGINWNVSSDASWCTVTGSGSGNGTFMAKYTEQAEHQTRSAKITLTPDGSQLPQTVTLLQTYPQGIEENVASLIRIYPNPTPGRFTIESKDQNNRILSVLITDLSGKKIRSLAAGHELVFQIDLSNCDQGSYLVTIETGKGSETRVVKIAK